MLVECQDKLEVGIIKIILISTTIIISHIYTSKNHVETCVLQIIFHFNKLCNNDYNNLHYNHDI